LTDEQSRRQTLSVDQYLIRRATLTDLLFVNSFIIMSKSTSCCATCATIASQTTVCAVYAALSVGRTRNYVAVHVHVGHRRKRAGCNRSNDLRRISSNNNTHFLARRSTAVENWWWRIDRSSPLELMNIAPAMCKRPPKSRCTARSGSMGIRQLQSYLQATDLSRIAVISLVPPTAAVVPQQTYICSVTDQLHVG
jgi:hypothetical protein